MRQFLSRNQFNISGGGRGSTTTWDLGTCPGVAREMIAVGMMCLGLLSGQALAGRVYGIRTPMLEPIAINGGVLMLPLHADTPGDHWPATYSLRLSNGRHLDGRVVWIDTDNRFAPTRWTDDPRGLAVRPICPTDDSAGLDANSSLGPFLVARLPFNVQGVIQFGKQTLTPRWIEPPFGFTRRKELLPTLPRHGSTDLPDPDSPFEFWRWSLMARKLGVNTPQLDFDESQRLVADYLAGLWLFGMDNLIRVNSKLADECLNLLTRVGSDGDRSIALWSADPRRSGQLLSLLIDPNRIGNDLAEPVGSWIEQHAPLLFWKEAEYPDHVRLVVVNTSNETTVVTFRWMQASSAPIAFPFEPGMLKKVRLDRMSEIRDLPGRLPGPGIRDAEILLVQVRGRQYRMDFTPPMVTAVPPGLYFSQFANPLTLADIQMGRQNLMSPSHATIAHVRRLDGRWEMFFDCRRPSSGLPENQSSATSVLGAFSNHADVRGVEAVTLLIGSEGEEDDARFVLTVPETGAFRLFRGANDGTLEIHRRSYLDRWYCRIVLPDDWLKPKKGPYVLIGCVRSHLDFDQVETSPSRSLPWRLTPARIPIDLSQWTNLPEFTPDEGA